MNGAVRPTKKQRELLDFIENFINEHGYSPSYREIMNGLQYNSVATVALHVGNLIKRGHLQKRDHSARSLEVVRHPAGASAQAGAGADEGDGDHESWLVDRVKNYLSQLAEEPDAEFGGPADGQLLLDALRLLGLQQQADSLQGQYAGLQTVPVDAREPNDV